MWQGRKSDSKPHRHPRHALLENGREIGQQNRDPKRYWDIDVGGEFRVITCAERSEDEVEIGFGTSQRNRYDHGANQHGRCSFHDFLSEVLAGGVVALEGDDENHQGKCSTHAVIGGVGVQHLVDDGDDACCDSDHDKIECSVRTQCHLHRDEGNQDNGKAEFPTDHTFRPANPRADTGDEDGHGGVGGDAPAETGIAAVSPEEEEVPEGQEETGGCLSVNTVGIRRPIHFGVSIGRTKPIQFEGSRGVTHHESGTP